MKLKDFARVMKKAVFSVAEAERVAWETSPQLLHLQLHQWAKAGDLVRLKRGVYTFPNRVVDKMEIAAALYGPCYVSLEYALQHYGLIPDTVFAVTLVSPKITRYFRTKFGEFSYQKIRQNLFWGYDPVSLMGEREKVLLDYFYLHSGHLQPRDDFWKEQRWQNLAEIDFVKAKAAVRRFVSKRVTELLFSLERFKKRHGKS